MPAQVCLLKGDLLSEQPLLGIAEGLPASTAPGTPSSCRQPELSPAGSAPPAPPAPLPLKHVMAPGAVLGMGRRMAGAKHLLKL